MASQTVTTMEPKFRISNIVPNMPQGTVTAFYVWDNGQVDSYTVPAQTATLESLVEIGFLRQAELDYKEQRMQEILAELAQGVDEIVGAPE